MTAIARVTLDGTSDVDLGIQLLQDYDAPVLPGVRERFVEVAGRAGRHEFDGDLAARMLNLRFAIVDATTRAELASLIRDLADLLVDDAGHPTDVTIVFDTEPNKTYTGRYAGGVPISRLIGGTVGEFTLPLLCSDPYAYGAEDTDTENITADYQTFEAENAGDFNTPPTITVEVNDGSGSVTGFEILVRQLKG